jgi:hypothetical protein
MEDPVIPEETFVGGSKEESSFRVLPETILSYEEFATFSYASLIQNLDNKVSLTLLALRAFAWAESYDCRTMLEMSSVVWKEREDQSLPFYFNIFATDSFYKDNKEMLWIA